MTPDFEHNMVFSCLHSFPAKQRSCLCSMCSIGCKSDQLGAIYIYRYNSFDSKLPKRSARPERGSLHVIMSETMSVNCLGFILTHFMNRFSYIYICITYR